jgi:hypothetical protein
LKLVFAGVPLIRSNYREETRSDSYHRRGNTDHKTAFGHHISVICTGAPDHMLRSKRRTKTGVGQFLRPPIGSFSADPRKVSASPVWAFLAAGRKGPAKKKRSTISALRLASLSKAAEEFRKLL